MGVYERFSLAGKVAVVTGGGRGIGRAIALAFAEAGADVAVMARRQADVDTVAAEIAFAGRRSLGIAGDLTLERTIPDALDRVIAELGGLHIMVNNAGGNPDGLAHPVAEMSLEKWDELLAHNMRHKFWGSNQAARRMGEGGRIINVVSRAVAVATPGSGAYAAGNAGIVAMSKTMAVELGPRKITVNCIAPGVVETNYLKAHAAVRLGLTDLTPEGLQAFQPFAAPAGRIGQPDDIAAAALYLASPAAEWITGECIMVSGGR